MKEGIPSTTALAIAYIVLILGQTAYSLLPAGIVPLQMALLEAVGLPWKDSVLLSLLKSPFGPTLSWFIRWYVGIFSTDALECVAFRKAIIEQQVCQFLEANNDATPQVLVLAAGYDTMPLRLAPRYPNVNFWEIDHPATGDFKNKIWSLKDNKSYGPLKIIGDKPPNLIHACVDLTQKDALAKTLGAQNDNYNISNPTIVIIEGLTMYLTTPQAHNLLEEVWKAVGPGSMAVFDMLQTKYVNNKQYPDIGISSKFLVSLVAAYLKWKSEPWLLGLDARILHEFIEKSDTWRLTKVQSFGVANVAAIQTRKK